MDLLDLLPQSPQTQVPEHIKYSKLLSYVRFLVENLLNAYKAFYINKHLYEFDPHVGETACQIRAYQVLNYFNKYNNAAVITERYQYFHEKLNKINNAILYYQPIDMLRRSNNPPSYSLKEFLLSNDYLLQLTAVEFFLVQARILTLYKTANHNGDHIIDYMKLTKEMKVSKNTARQFVHHFQINLSKLSCDFILELSNHIPNVLKIDNAVSMVKFDDDGRYVLPHFFTSKILYYHMLETKQKILLIAHRISNNYCIDSIYLPFSIAKNTKIFIHHPECLHQFHKEPFYVIQGITNYDPCQPENQKTYISRLLKLGLKKALLLNMAAHPQFSGKKLAHHAENPFLHLIDKSNTHIPFIKNYEKLKNNAHFWGCNFSNQSLFYIKHIYCDTLSHLQGINFKYSIDIYNKINKNIRTAYDQQLTPEASKI